jgi:hypothetical protein
MIELTGVSRARQGPAGPVRAVSVVSTGTVRIHPEQLYGSRKPTYWWLFTSQRWSPPLSINVYVIEHAQGLLVFDTGQDGRPSPMTIISLEALPGFFMTGLPASTSASRRR